MAIPNAGYPPPAAPCPSCGQPTAAGTRFCPHCGSAVGTARSGAARSDFLRGAGPWLLGGALVMAVLALLLRQPAPPGTPAAATPGAAAATPPDISGMSPRERFNRLYDRVIAAAQTGDQATVQQFTPMAIAAFGMLDTVDADARYHLAMIELHVGDTAGAQAQADTLMASEPDHLFGYVIDGAVARWTGNEAARNRAQGKFLERYDAEMKRARPEYDEHRKMLDELRRTAAGS